MGLSRKQVNDAGDVMREWMDDSAIELSDPHFETMDIIGQFRREFQDPLTRVVMGLRSMVAKLLPYGPETTGPPRTFWPAATSIHAQDGPRRNPADAYRSDF